MSGFVSREDKLSNELGFDSGSDDDRSGPIDARRGTSSAAKAPAPPPLGIARAVAGSGFGDVSKQHAASHIVEGGSIGSVDGKTLSELERTIGDLIEQKASLEMRLKSSDDAKNNAETRLALYRRSIQVSRSTANQGSCPCVTFAFRTLTFFLFLSFPLIPPSIAGRRKEAP